MNQSSLQVQTKILAWLIELVTGGVPGSNGDVSVTNASSPTNHQVIKTSAGILHSVQAHNSSGSTRYLLVFDAIAMPANGTTPVLAPVQIPADSTGSIDYGQRGRNFSNGIVAVFSSTSTILTNAGGGMFDAVYR